MDSTFTLLHRVNPDRDEARYYSVMIGPTLVDPLAVVRTWGRIGGFEKQLITPVADAAAARRLAGRLIRRRLKRGYTIVQQS